MKFNLALSFVLVGTFALVSCSEKDLYDESKVEKKVDELVIPAGFDWSMISDVMCNVTAPAGTKVSIYTSDDYSENSLVAEYTTDSPEDQEGMLLQLPDGTTKLYAKAGDVKQVVEIKDGVATYAIPGTRSSAEESIEPQSIGVKWFPSFCDWATVMFEDNFPVKGDYDFNDVVINYKYVATMTPIFNKINLIKFDVKVRALGGRYDYKPYLRITGANKLISSVEGEGITQVGENDFAISIDEYTQKPNGAEFLNTKLDEERVADSECKTITFSMVLNLGFGVSQDDFKVDFYLKGKGHEGQTYEIHQRGFDPVDSNYYPSTYSTLGNTSYTTSEGLVWGITIPANVPHALEKADFLKAYPSFAEWVQSGGSKSPKWYNTRNNDYLFPLN